MAASSITVEFFGLARSRAGVASTTASGANLGDVLADVATRFPRLADSCISGRSLGAGFTANRDGECFVTDPETPLTPGETILIMSLDAGG